MDTRALIDFCRSLPQVTEDIKWGHDLVFSIGGKMFACFDPKDDTMVSFKTTPPGFAVLTAMDGIKPAPYLGRFDWVAIENPDVLPQEMIKELVFESYRLVMSRLPLRVRETLQLDDETGGQK